MADEYKDILRRFVDIADGVAYTYNTGIMDEVIDEARALLAKPESPSILETVNNVIDGGLTRLADAMKPVEESFQSRVNKWIVACFGNDSLTDKTERNHRFLEEVLEAVQASGRTASEAHQLVDYVFSRPVGEIHQEIGGVMNTLAAFATANNIDMNEVAEAELERIWKAIPVIQAKRVQKPTILT